MSLPSKGTPEKGITAYGAKVHNRHERMLSRLKDALACVRQFRLTADEMYAKSHEVISSKYLPPEYRGHLDGYADATQDAIWREVRWQLYLDGAKVTSSEISRAADLAEQNGIDRGVTWGKVQGRHEWPDGKPFTQFEPVK